MNLISETEVVQACQTLFGKKIDISKDFLYKYIQPSGVKSAYRKKAKKNHPDLFASDPVSVQQKQTVLFREILGAYDILTLFFKQREEGAGKPHAKPDSRKTEAHDAQYDSAGCPRSGDDTFYRGVVPHRTLQIGQYLYYRGKINFGALIAALMWQRKQRPSIGDIALEWGLLDRAKVDRIFGQCGRPRLFGEKAVELGLLTVFQVNTILLYQRSHQSRLGNYFIENKLLTPSVLDAMVRELKQHNASILAGSREKSGCCQA